MKRENIIIVILSSLLIMFTVGGYLSSKSNSVREDIGVYAVQKLYTFEDINDLPGQLLQLKPYLSDEAWDYLNLDNESRAITAYYKFATKGSQAVTVDVKPGLVAYRILNPNVSAEVIFLFEYEINRGKLDNIKEYYLSYKQYGGEQIW